MTLSIIFVNPPTKLPCPHCLLRVAADCNRPSLKSLPPPSLLPFPPQAPYPTPPHPHTRTELPTQPGFLVTDFSFLLSLMAPPSFSKVSTMEAPDWRPCLSKSSTLPCASLCDYIQPAASTLWRLTTPTWHVHLWFLLWDSMQICGLDICNWSVRSLMGHTWQFGSLNLPPPRLPHLGTWYHDSSNFPDWEFRSYLASSLFTSSSPSPSAKSINSAQKYTILRPLSAVIQALSKSSSPAPGITALTSLTKVSCFHSGENCVHYI